MILVDTYNVLHVTGVLPPEMAGMEAVDLANAVRRMRYPEKRFTLVCDGIRPGAGHQGPSMSRVGDVCLRYTGAGREADDEIEDVLSRTTFPRRVLVVSSDNRLRRAAKKRGSKWMKSEAFLEELVEDLGRGETDPLPKWVREVPLSHDAIEHWLGDFGLGADDPLMAIAGGERALLAPDRAEAEDELAASESDDAVGDAGTSGGEVEADEELRSLLDEAGGEIDAGELDMRKWLGGDQESD